MNSVIRMFPFGNCSRKLTGLMHRFIISKHVPVSLHVIFHYASRVEHFDMQMCFVCHNTIIEYGFN